MKQLTLFAIVTIALLSSCNSAKKMWYKAHIVKDSSFYEEHESGARSSLTLAGSHKVDSSHTEETVNTTKEGVTIHLDPDKIDTSQEISIVISPRDPRKNRDTSKTKGSTMIFKIPKGTATIDAYVTNLEGHTGTDRTFTDDSLVYQYVDTTHLKETKDGTIHTESTVDRGNKWVWRISIPVLILAVAGFFIWFVYFRRRSDPH